MVWISRQVVLFYCQFFTVFKLYLWGPASLWVLRFPGAVAGFPTDPCNKCDIMQHHRRSGLFASHSFGNASRIYQVEMSQFKLGTQRCFFPAQLRCCRSYYSRASLKLLTTASLLGALITAGRQALSFTVPGKAVLCLTKSLLTL